MYSIHSILETMNTFVYVCMYTVQCIYIVKCIMQPAAHIFQQNYCKLQICRQYSLICAIQTYARKHIKQKQTLNFPNVIYDSLSAELATATFMCVVNTFERINLFREQTHAYMFHMVTFYFRSCPMRKAYIDVVATTTTVRVASIISY